MDECFYDIAILIVDSENCGEREQGNDGKYNEENGFFHFFHDLASCAAAQSKQHRILSVPSAERTIDNYLLLYSNFRN